VQGFYTKTELELLIQRRSSQKSLADTAINSAIVERYYQTRAIRHIAEAFEHQHQRKALVVMATGAGKTRTVIALSDLLMRCNWAKRVLFLADRVALVNQAVNAFKKHLPDSSPVNLVTDPDEEGRVFVSTYPTMMGLIDDAKDGQKRFGVGHFDVVIIDEAHRSVYQKYRAIFEYFDSLLVGLTATPKDLPDWASTPCSDISHANTYEFQATMPPDTSVPEMRQMMQAFLADRFKLTVHSETKNMPVYALVIGPGGFKLKPSDPKDDPPRATGSIGCPLDDRLCHIMVMGSTPISKFADLLSRVIGRPIIDMPTGCRCNAPEAGARHPLRRTPNS
jgi:hypothetical protein